MRALAARTGIAVLLFGGGWLLLAKASGGWAATPQLLLGMSCFVAAAIVIAPPIARLLAEPSGSLFYPRIPATRVQPMYSIPQANRKKGLTQESFDGFNTIAEEHPQDIEAYIEMMDIAMRDMKNAALAASIFQHGMATLKDEKARASLTTMYKAISSRGKAPPSPRRAIRLPTSEMKETQT
ncbi:MAG: hypothetical protein HQ523_01250 [Lentisphaerae bacterium]|nr:hypothetical protein [Lentisphaerota bacterium]